MLDLQHYVAKCFLYAFQRNPGLQLEFEGETLPLQHRLEYKAREETLDGLCFCKINQTKSTMKSLPVSEESISHICPEP